MRQILFLDCCAREEESRTLRLCNYFMEELKKKEPDLQIKVRRLHRERIPAMDQEALAWRDRLLAEDDWENPLFEDVKEFAAADGILIGAPYWDFSFPACLKNYIEHICVNGLLFTYVEDGSVGLCRADKMMYISTAGGFVPESGHMGEQYMRQLCDFFGIGEFSSFCVQGLDIWGVNAEEKMEEAERMVREAAKGW